MYLALFADSGDEWFGNGDGSGRSFVDGDAAFAADELGVLPHRADLETSGEAAKHVVDKFEFLSARKIHAREEFQLFVIFTAQEIEWVQKNRGTNAERTACRESHVQVHFREPR
jgi:hypothetical protein